VTHDPPVALDSGRYRLLILLDTLATNFRAAFPEYGPTDPQNMIQLLAATVMTQRRLARETAERCLVIAAEPVTTPDGSREKCGSEIAHQIMREELHQGGM
jgi:hypothetical protein